MVVFWGFMRCLEYQTSAVLEWFDMNIHHQSFLDGSLTTNPLEILEVSGQVAFSPPAR